MKPPAALLNDIIREQSDAFEMLSREGARIFFPNKGILKQAAEAAECKINATIGIALEEDGSPMRLKCIEDNFARPPIEIFPYASSFGKKELRQRWKEMMMGKNPSLQGKAFSMPVVTQALTHGLFLARSLFLNEGEKIKVPAPFWGVYRLGIEEAHNAHCDSFPLFDQERFNLKGLEEKLAEEDGKKVFLMNFPNNPTGYSITQSEYEAIVDCFVHSGQQGKKIVVICDDAYFGLNYKDDVAKESLFAALCDAHENVLAVKLDAATKEDYAWGFRVGFITYGIKGGTEDFYRAMEEKTAGAIRAGISNVPHISQSILLAAYNDPSYNSEKMEKFELLKRRFDTFGLQFQEHPEYLNEMDLLPCNSGYFACVQPKKDAEEIRKLLLEVFSTGVIATNGLIRSAFSSVPTPKIPTLVRNIYEASKQI